MIAGGGVCNHFNVKGFRFQPTDEELVKYHLNPKILDPDSDRHYIGDIKDLSQLEPSDLFRETQKNPDDKEGYFFCSPTYTNYKKDRISRKGKNGSWGETRRWDPVSIDSGEESLIAKKRVLVFHKDDCPERIRTNWFIYEFELTISHPDPIHQDKTKIFVCKLFKNDRRSGSKRKRGDNVQETSAKPRTAKKGNSLRKKAKVSSAQVAQLDDDHDNNNNNNNNHIMSCEVVHGSQSLSSDLDSILSELTPQSHHLSSKYFSSNNMPEGGHYRSTGGLHPSNGFPGDIQSFDDNQSHHLSSNSINNISTGVGMQPSHYFPSSTPEENSNEDPQYNEQRKEESQLSFQLPLDPKNDIISSGLLQQSHHRLPSNCEERIGSLEGGSLDCMDEDAKYYQGISVEELLAQLPPQPPTAADDHGCNELPPITDVNRGADQLQDQRGSNEEDDASFWASLPQLY